MENKLKNLINILVKEEFNLLEKKKKAAAEEENIDIDLNTEEPPIDMSSEENPPAEPSMDINLDTDGGGGSAEKRIGQGLQMALDAAKEMQDGETKDKLIRQIGNTALFFLKTQIPTGGTQL